MRRIFVLALTAIFVALASPTAFADGCAMPPVAVKKPPEIPTQRAVLTFRNGMERMVIESTFNGPGERLGWVIPVPAEPTNLESAPPGCAGQLELFTRPEVRHTRRIFTDHPLLLLLSSLMMVACLAIMNGVKRPILLTLVVAILAIIYLILTPKYASRSGGAATIAGNGVTSTRQELVGNYSVEVLKAKDTQALNEWLTANGFMRLTTDGEKITGGLINEGWSFVTAKLQRKGAELCRPHPIAITFPSKRLLYPMRLTALAGAPVYLEVFTIADQMATTPMLTTEFCGQYQCEPIGPKGETSPQLNGEFFPLFGESRSLWPGCWVTRLTGTLPPDRMNNDITFSLKKPHTFVRRYYSKAGAASLALAWGMLIWSSGAIFLTLSYAIRSAEERKTEAQDKAQWRKFFLAVLGGAALVVCGVYFWLPRTAITNQSPVWKIMTTVDVNEYYSKAEFIEMTEELKPGRSLEELRQALRGPEDIYSNADFVEGVAPGNYELIENADGSLDYLIHMRGGALWGNRLRQPKKREGDLSEEDLNKMLDALEAK